VFGGPNKMNLIAEGAEARIFKDKKKIIKERISKSYRIKEIDEELRKKRTKREAKILKKLNSLGFNAPKIAELNDFSITMEFIEGDQLKKVFEKNYKQYSCMIGKGIAWLHKNNIIHGDLTTSNMILKKNYKNAELFFIDFGLSFISTKIEDKAVDLHLLKQSLESKHYKIFDEGFNIIIEEYKREYIEGNKIIERLANVEARGRNKQ
jgi:TP53 regulating kinase-like protein